MGFYWIIPKVGIRRFLDDILVNGIFPLIMGISKLYLFLDDVGLKKTTTTPRERVWLVVDLPL